jgi:hypothetical protein
MVPLGSASLIEDGKGPLKGGRGSVEMKPGGDFPKGVGPPGVLDAICVGMTIEAFNAQYLGGSVRVTLGKRSMPMGAWLATVILV